MKIRFKSWGTQIAIWMGVFMIFIIVLVYKSMQQEFSLVEKDYYPKGLEYQQMLEKKERGSAFSDQIKIENQGGNLILTYPLQLLEAKDLKGNIWFYHREYDKYDLETIVEPDTNARQIFPSSAFQQGRYLMKIDWEMNGTSYYVEKSFSIK